MSKKHDEIKGYSVPNLTPKVEEKQKLSNEEFRKILIDVCEAFAAAGKPVTGITVQDADREVKITPEFLKQKPH